MIINTLKGLPRTRRDAAFGLCGLFTLYLIRYVCDRLTKRYPRRGAPWRQLLLQRTDHMHIRATLLLHLDSEDRIRHGYPHYCVLALRQAPEDEGWRLPNKNSQGRP